MNHEDTRSFLELGAECFLGDRIEVRSVPLLARGVIKPGAYETLCFSMPEPGVPLDITGAVGPLCIERVHAGMTPLYPGAFDEGLGTRRKLRGALCSAREVVTADLGNRSRKEVSYACALLYAPPPVVMVPLTGPWGEEWGPKTIGAMNNMEPIVRIVREPYKAETDPFDGIRAPLRNLGVMNLESLPSGWGVHKSSFSQGRELVACEGQMYDRYGAILAFMVSPEVAPHFWVTDIVLGETTVVSFRCPIPAGDFEPGPRIHPAMPFITVPPRQSVRVEGFKAHDDPAPAFMGRLICAFGDKCVA
jgi:hypothetical protein